MRIGIIIGRIGGVDGVALETEKWIEVFRRMGHDVYIISGQYEERKMDPEFETLVSEMSFFSPESYWGQKKAFFFPDTNVDELLEHINLYSKVIYKKIIDWVHEKKIDLLISENASALPSHLEMGLAIKKAVLKLGLPTITHDHDFAWERGNRYISPHDKINRFVEETFPLRAPNSVHAVINTHAQNTLKKKFGRDSVNVPNVMDFDIPFGVPSVKNNCLHKDLGFRCEDILLFQITRVVQRKGIETAIELIDKLHDKNIKLVITGNYNDDAGSKYYAVLIELIHKLRLGNQVSFAHHLFNNKGLTQSASAVNYSLSDAYAQARACTYFSTYEGFGNAFVEAVLAKRPIFVNNYEPVYMPDIGSKGFKTVMINNSELTDQAVEEMKEIIYNEKLNKEIGEYNFLLGKKYFSYDTLQEKLQELLDSATKLA
ncbi:MAG: glycosyltransferase family 4 protein [Bacteroidales bacterium]|nr:glycosyltransferase family 4 protein [Bacteroidales bacterium]